MRIAVNGACGRMGQAVLRLAKEAGFEVAAAIDVVDAPGVVRSLEGRADVLVDFSLPPASMDRLEECVRTRTPMVIGTTGFTEAQRSRIDAAAKEIPVLLSANMSVGMNILFKLVPGIVKALGKEYDLDIVETHHRFKKDAPSGTARTLAEKIEAATGRRASMHAVRSGDVVGEHRVILGTLGESIEIVHRAGSRDIFARGAIEAARWLSGAKPGLYSMADVVAAG
jgi:4-hydroxy-tetrahydrodipicolinate reductase